MLKWDSTNKKSIFHQVFPKSVFETESITYPKYDLGRRSLSAVDNTFSSIPAIFIFLKSPFQLLSCKLLSKDEIFFLFSQKFRGEASTRILHYFLTTYMKKITHMLDWSSLLFQAILKHLQKLNDIFPPMDVQLWIQPSSQSTHSKLLLIKWNPRSYWVNCCSKFFCMSSMSWKGTT